MNNIKNTKNIITIDGTSGSGKTTVAQILCEKLKYTLLDSGSHYRALAYILIKEKCEQNNLGKYLKYLKYISLQDEKIFFRNINISSYLYNEDIAAKASLIARNIEVRLLASILHRRTVFDNGLVATGRDMGSVVFKEAPFKFFLKISNEEASIRRFNQLKKNNHNANLEIIKSMIIKRDAQDSNRSVAPLIVPEDAYSIDTTKVNAEQVSQTIINIINNIRDKQ